MGNNSEGNLMRFSFIHLPLQKEQTCCVVSCYMRKEGFSCLQEEGKMAVSRQKHL